MRPFYNENLLVELALLRRAGMQANAKGGLMMVANQARGTVPYFPAVMLHVCKCCRCHHLMPANQAGAYHTGISMQMLPRPTRGIHPACAASTRLQHILTLVHSLLRFCSGLNQTHDFTSLYWLNKCLFAAASSLAVRWFWQVTPSAWNAFESHSVLFYRDASYHPHRHCTTACIAWLLAPGWTVSFAFVSTVNCVGRLALPLP